MSILQQAERAIQAHVTWKTVLTNSVDSVDRHRTTSGNLSQLVSLLSCICIYVSVKFKGREKKGSDKGGWEEWAWGTTTVATIFVTFDLKTPGRMFHSFIRITDSNSTGNHPPIRITEKYLRKWKSSFLSREFGQHDCFNVFVRWAIRRLRKKSVKSSPDASVPKRWLTRQISWGRRRAGTKKERFDNEWLDWMTATVPYVGTQLPRTKASLWLLCVPTD